MVKIDHTAWFESDAYNIFSPGFVQIGTLSVSGIGIESEIWRIASRVRPDRNERKKTTLNSTISVERHHPSPPLLAPEIDKEPNNHPSILHPDTDGTRGAAI
ncbi:hypothetical protein EVAR_63233_1 [Eumeta japonica]|uniref:Uncharacterized protein n=1 Tax=Eumeta variegata TaxID=151549 RepID=A0A4C1ZBX0_EUMVA|nr:hypothetical protein EVAR_63233_1 [Eumeta japonica]